MYIYLNVLPSEGLVSTTGSWDRLWVKRWYPCRTITSAASSVLMVVRHRERSGAWPPAKGAASSSGLYRCMCPAAAAAPSRLSMSLRLASARRHRELLPTLSRSIASPLLLRRSFTRRYSTSGSNLQPRRFLLFTLGKSRRKSSAPQRTPFLATVASRPLRGGSRAPPAARVRVHVGAMVRPLSLFGRTRGGG